MKLLICTQAVDAHDPALGFFIRWIEEFSKHADHVTVVCLRAGTYALPPNVHVYTLGKSNKVVRAYRLLKLSWKLRARYDSVFVHMNPEYVVVSGWLWRLMRKKITLWYAHKSVTLKLRLATRFVTSTASVTERSFPLSTPKHHALGHGIDTRLFSPQPHHSASGFRLISIGRIAESKHEIEMLEIVELLKKEGHTPTLTIAGNAGTPRERKYKETLDAEIQRRGLGAEVHMIGAVPHASLPELLSRHDVMLNFGSTGNMDKAGFEPLAMGIPMVSTNIAFKEVLEPYGLYAPLENPSAIIEAIVHAQTVDMAPLVQYTREHHALEALIPKILETLS